ncbi:hypothetical protein COCVIDRAFT_116475 [Bipolaris victoriae FI3]|uniref:Uncharacterized protein n=1 Tax=Bipolaris victoriae (strain FI3) TaxID=930091 RepID=W7DQL2_BIPV3|nr:hypothetical protein COCVIDRAFT_116475 [Bipolaris victoriae FI3]
MSEQSTIIRTGAIILSSFLSRDLSVDTRTEQPHAEVHRYYNKVKADNILSITNSYHNVLSLILIRDNKV